MSEVLLNTIPTSTSAGERARYKFLILGHPQHDGHLAWAEVCEKAGQEHRSVDLVSDDWFDSVQAEKFDCLLAYPPVTETLKQVYDERVYVLSQVLGYRIYPSFEELMLYENKRLLSSWLRANKIPHPRTQVICSRQEALRFLDSCDIPIVAKTSVGALATGVTILRSRKAVAKYIQKAFSKYGIRRRFGPNLRKVDLLGRVLSKLSSLPTYVRDLAERRKLSETDSQRGFVIFQEYFSMSYEWRAVRIGESYFAHKKLPHRGELMSGTSRVGWGRPPESLLEFTKDVCDSRGFYSQAVDVFEPSHGDYRVNELQCFFGSHHPHQMLIDGKPCRFLERNGDWQLEFGTFNEFNSFWLRMQHILELLATDATVRPDSCVDLPASCGRGN